MNLYIVHYTDADGCRGLAEIYAPTKKKARINFYVEYGDLEIKHIDG